MREYTRRSIMAKGIALARDIADGLSGIVEAFNGNLDANQMPLESVDVSMIAYGTKTTTQRISPFNRRYKTIASDWDEATAIASWSRDSSDWSAASWIPLSDKLQNGGDSITLELEEGVVEGVFVVDAGKAASLETASGNDYGNEHQGWEAGVFANGQILMRSGWVWCRRETVRVPFIHRVGNETITYTLRWRAYQDDSAGGFSAGGVLNPDEIDAAPFEVWGAALYINNKVR